MKQTPEQQAEVQIRVRRALVNIERAQNDLNQACSELSSFLNGSPEWKRAGKLADQVKALWYRVQDRSSRYGLDDMATQSMMRRNKTYIKEVT